MAFGKFRHSNIKGEKGSDWNIEIWKDGFSGSSTEFDMQGEGFEVTWNGEGSTRKRTFIASSCTINFFVQNANDETFAYDVLAAGFQTFYVRIYKGAITSDNANIWWYGWIQPSFDVLENVPFPYVYKLIATDSYGYFNKLKPFYFASQQAKLNDVTSVFNSLFLPLLSNTSDSKLNIGGSTSNNLNPAPDSFKFFRTSANWWRSGDTFSTQTNPLNLYYVSPGAYAAKTEFDEDNLVTNQLDSLEYKIQDIFNGNLQLFNLVGFLAEGKYNFIQPNNLVNNTTGALNTFIQSNLSSAQTLQNFTTDLLINQTDNVILGGSSIILDPPLESVKVKWEQAESSFNLDEGTNIEGQTIDCGFLELNSGVYTFNYNTVNFTTVLKSAFNFADTNHGVFSNTFTTTSVLTVKLTNGSNNYYLQETSEGLIWTLNNSNVLSLNIKRGYNTEGLFGVINNSENIPNMNVANPTDFQPVLQVLTQNYTGGGGGGDFPCKRLPDFGSGSSTKSKFKTNLSFSCEVQQPPISGSVSITVNTSIDYQERDINGGHIITDIVDPTASTNVTEVLSGLSLTPSEANVQSGAGSGITFSASQTTTTALESLDLNDSRIGQSAVNTLYSVKYQDNPLYPPATSGFRRGNLGDYINILQLGVKEFLDLQTKPLEILQADIQSNDISPLKLIKYSINDDNNFKYYSFLGGTFKAQSEIMSGEWYKVENSTTIINDDPTTSAEFAFNPVANNANQIASSLSNTNKIITTNLNVNILGVVDTALTSNVAVTLISLNANVAGKFYTNQKLFLALPDGTGQLEITCSATKTSVSDIDVVSIAPKRDYPVGSIVLVKTADLTNVITGSGGGTPGGSSTQVQYNKAGAFEGVAGFEFDEGNNKLKVKKIALQEITGEDNNTLRFQIDNNPNAGSVGTGLRVVSMTGVDVILNGVNGSAEQFFSITNFTTGNKVLTVSNTGVLKVIGNKITDSAGGSIIDSSVSGTTKISGIIKADSNKIQDSAGTDRIDISDNNKTKIDKNLQLLGSSPATIFSPDADKLILSSVDNLEFKIASGGASSKSFKFINNTTEVGSINSSGDLQIDGTFLSGDVTSNGNTATMSAVQTNITTITNAALKIGRDADNLIEFNSDNIIDFRVGSGDVIRLSMNQFRPSQNNVMSLGFGTIAFKNLFLGSGATINFNNADVVLTHSANLLTITGGNVDIVGTLDTDNLTISGTQGTDGQVLTSTGSGVAWEDASGGGGGGTNTNIANTDLTLNAGRTLNVDDNTLEIKNGTTVYLGFDDSGINSFLASDDLDIGNFNFRAKSFTSDVATGTAPFVVSSTTAVANLQSSTTASIGNLTGEVTSTNRATVIADNIVDEANLKVSNAPVNGYVLTAQSGNTGGLTWAEQASGGGSSSSIITQVFSIAYFNTTTNGFYITMSGASTSESTALSTGSYHLILACPFNGTIKRITSHHSNQVATGTSKFELYINGDDSDLVGDQRGSDLTVSNGYNVSGSDGRVFTADCPSDWTFSKNETLAIRRTDSSARSGVTISLVVEFDTST